MSLAALESTDFNFPGQIDVYHGKVRDVYKLPNEKLLMVATDRISAFDHVLPRAIPYKGQVLNQIAAFFLEAVSDILPTWLEAAPDPHIAIGNACEPYKVEMVVRGYLSGHAWREYRDGKRMICGVPMPEGMKENDAFPEPILTPTTKAAEGHDEDISREEIITQGLINEGEYLDLEDYSRKLFQRGTEIAADRGLILVDTKYEFGKRNGEITLIDEIHTPDSSRYFYKDTYAELQSKGEKQRQLSKEFVREWLIEHDFQGLDGQRIPEMPDDFIEKISQRYIELFEKITAQKFKKREYDDIESQIEKAVLKYL
jgi:phosphoribosylaminoimidazole-succinocarboxamide synthase